MLIATVEAFRVCGYHRVRDSLVQLYHSYLVGVSSRIRRVKFESRCAHC